MIADRDENGNYIERSENGMVFRKPQYVDWEGEPIERTPDEYRYSYNAYVLWKDKDDYKDVVYCDRMRQWDYKKYIMLTKKYFGNESDYWYGRERKEIQNFLREYMDKPDLILVGMMTGCNVSSGYPYWIFMIDY